MGNPESQYAYWMMKERPQLSVLNRGINSQRSDEILARFQQDVLRIDSDYVIILAGVNDVYQNIPLESIKENLLTMYKLGIKNKIVPVVATVLPYHTASIPESRKIQELNRWIEDTSKRLGIPLCDTNGAVADPKNRNRLFTSSDQHHPDAAGYRRMGEALAKTILAHQDAAQKQAATRASLHSS
jgi:lysophospholipase L1-like esterase